MSKQTFLLEDLKNRGNAYHVSNDEESHSIGPQMMPPTFNLSSGDPVQTKKEDEEGSSAKDYVADGADKVNAIGNIIDPILDKFVGKANQAMATANELMQEAKVSAAAAKAKAAQAMAAQKSAGSGKSKIKNLKASKAAKASQAAQKASKIKAAKAANALKEAQKLKSLVPTLAKLLNKVPLSKIGFAAAFINKGLTSTNTTKAGVAVDALATAGLDAAFSKSHPLVAAIDAVIGLIPGGERFNISNTMSNSVSSITGAGESIITGDVSGISAFHEASKAGKNTWIFEQAAKAGEFWSENGGYERAKTTGDFWGGADSFAGRSTAFAASVPGLGHLGEGLGWTGFQVYDKGGKAIDATGNALSELDEAIMPEGRTLNPFKVDWDSYNPF